MQRYKKTINHPHNRFINMKSALIALILLAISPALRAGIADSLHYSVELQATLSHGNTPLWLNANRHGLSSLEQTNGYVRAAAQQPMATPDEKRWGLGYGLDIALAHGFTSTLVIQQAYAEARYLHGTLTIGSKQWPMELKNQRISSGSQTLGINARPVPQVRLALPEYWTIPILRGWLQLKGHIAYGRMTDDAWQHDFTARQTRYADKVLYHSKAGYLRIGNEERFCPWSLEMGLEMGTQFGGDIYRPGNDGQMEHYTGNTSPKGFIKAFIPGGGDPNETTYRNEEGNHLGSWLLRLNYNGENFGCHIYADHFFEDHSQMFLLDYNGYGEGQEWNTKKEQRYFVYDLKDMMLGLEMNFKNEHYLIQNICLEYLYTKYQSGPIYHDRTPAFSDHVSGRDNYYNHSLYPGWQHWGQVIGNPLYRSPIYNDNGTIAVDNNRFWALHLGLEAQPWERLGYRLMATYQKGFGTYDNPYTEPRHNVSIMLEATYKLPVKGLKACYLTAAAAMDDGRILGTAYGGQMTLKVEL